MESLESLGTTALIGHTGFVGGNLKAQHLFSHLFNSKNFLEMKGASFDTVVCAGVSAVKWLANREPEADRAAINALAEVLRTVKASRFILVSTVDVYPATRDVDEGYNCHAKENHPYGTHRLEFEAFCERTFPECYVLRLPGLFGDGLKKNVVFDLLNDNCLDAINTASSFQYLPLSDIWSLVDRCVGADLRLVNLVTEPVPTSEIVERFFPDKQVGASPGPEGHYDIHTRYAERLGGKGSYLMTKDEVLASLGRFIEEYRRG